MEYLKLNQVIEANKGNLQESINNALNQLEAAQQKYPNMILKVIESGNLGKQIELASTEATQDLQANPGSNLAQAAGPYFFNENILGGSREPDVLNYINQYWGDEIPNWVKQKQKLKLGPGIGFIQTPKIYQKLITAGIQDPNLSLNYTAPFGTSFTRQGIKNLMDSRINPEGDYFPDSGVFLTQGGTEGVDLFLEAMATLKPKSRVVSLGLSYYTGLFSAIQKGLAIDRLITSPIQFSEQTKFFPSAQEISTSLAKDTSALIITIPNNPNGETYSEQELSNIIQLAKDRDISILFDCIFENMYFNPNENYQSKLLKVATELNALDNIVVVDGLSKTKNFPGERIGFLATTNQSTISAITNAVLARRCNPRLTLEPLVLFESLARQVKAFQLESPNSNLDTIISKVLKTGEYPFSKTSFQQMFNEWDMWSTEVLKYYQDNLTLAKALLNSSVSAGSPDKAAMNTLFRMKGLNQGTNSMDFLAKLMFTMATYTQVGPCFGLSQTTWDNELGIWPRITYACSRKDLIESITRLIVFTQFYAEKNFGDPNQFPTLQINYESQV